jgi:hypothetical protein
MRVGIVNSITLQHKHSVEKLFEICAHDIRVLSIVKLS